MSNYFTKKSLISAVNNSATLIDLSFNEESSVIISEYGGRTLGIFPMNDNYSLLWIAPNIKENIERRDRMIGGDRYWISPERDFFYKNPDNWEGWFCPEGLDPANYEILGNDEKSCTLSSPITVMNMRTREPLRGEITRQFTIIKEPIKTGLNYCGIEFLDDCVFFKPGLKINGWSLANIISGGPDNSGTVLVPTKADPKPLSYFRPIPDDRLNIGKNYIAYKIDVDDIYKLAIRPDDINFERAAKIGYILNIPDSDDYGFLVKLSEDVPKSQDQCFDVARDHPESEIGVIQSYNSDSPNKPMLGYGEIELQLNLFETIDNTSHGKAKHQLFGYIGSKEDILNVVEKYLGIKNPKLF